MSSKNRKKKHSENEGYDFVKKYRLPDMMAYIFLILIFAVYPVITDNKYFNITITRYHFFCFAAGLYIGLCILAYIIEYAQARYFHYPSLTELESEPARWKQPEFWMLGFLCAQIFAWICASDKDAALNGSQGRFMGLIIYMLFAAMFLIMTKRLKSSSAVYLLFMGACVYSYVIAIGQYMDNDFMHYKQNISAKQYDTFISTFGNINIFACFLSISIPVFMALVVFSKHLLYRIAAGLMLVLAGMCVLIANSDSVFLGLFATLVLFFFLAYWKGYICRLMMSLCCLATGNLVLAFITKYGHTRFDRKRGGLSLTLNRMDVAIVGVCACLVLLGLLYFVKAKWGHKIETWNKKKVILGIASAGALAMIVIVIIGVHMQSSYFVFNDKWGTYRGFIWKRVVGAYGEAPLVNKIFGYGNESVRVIMNNYCHDEMVKVTHRVYDNAHNELLQYLLTTGLVGMITYIGLFVSSVVYMLKNAKDNVIAYVSLAVTVSYFTQGLLNLNQPITTPFYFVFLAMGIGSVNYYKRLEEVEKHD